MIKINSKLYTADEVRLIQETELETVLNRQIDQINKCIGMAINQNQSKIILPISTHEQIISALKENGFSIQSPSFEEGTSNYVVSW